MQSCWQLGEERGRPAYLRFGPGGASPRTAISLLEVLSGASSMRQRGPTEPNPRAAVYPVAKSCRPSSLPPLQQLVSSASLLGTRRQAEGKSAAQNDYDN